MKPHLLALVMETRALTYMLKSPMTTKTKSKAEPLESLPPQKENGRTREIKGCEGCSLTSKTNYTSKHCIYCLLTQLIMVNTGSQSRNILNSHIENFIECLEARWR